MLIAPYIYFRFFLRNWLFLASLEQITARPKFQLRPLGLAIHHFRPLPRNHNCNVGSALWASPFELRKCTSPHFFRPFSVRLAVLDVPHLTPVMLSVKLFGRLDGPTDTCRETLC